MFCLDFCLGPSFAKEGKMILGLSSFFLDRVSDETYCTRAGRTLQRAAFKILYFFDFLFSVGSSSGQEGAFPLMRFNLESVLSEI